MLFSLSQQIIRQDPQYRALYACLRPDRSRSLVSYPYYAKNAQAGDSTYSKHIDMNIPKYLAYGNGGNIIQGSMSLEVDRAKSCIKEYEAAGHNQLKSFNESTDAFSQADPNLQRTSLDLTRFRPSLSEVEANSPRGERLPTPRNKSQERSLEAPEADKGRSGKKSLERKPRAAKMCSIFTGVRYRWGFLGVWDYRAKGFR